MNKSMNKRTRTIIMATALTLLFVCAGAVAWAQTSADFDLRWHVIGNGGSASNSADYRVSGTVGQSTTGTTTASSTDFKVTGGFWADVPVSTPAPTFTPTSTTEPTSEPTAEPTSEPTPIATSTPEESHLPFIIR